MIYDIIHIYIYYIYYVLDIVYYVLDVRYYILCIILRFQRDLSYSHDREVWL